MGNTNATPTTSNLPKLFLSIGEHLSSYSRTTSTSQKKSILFQLIHDLDRAKILLRMVAPASSTLNGTSTTETTMASTPLATSVDTCFDIATEILIMSVGSDNDSKVAGSLLKIFDVDRKVNGPSSSSSSSTKPKKKSNQAIQESESKKKKQFRHQCHRGYSHQRRRGQQQRRGAWRGRRRSGPRRERCCRSGRSS